MDDDERQNINKIVTSVVIVIILLLVGAIAVYAYFRKNPRQAAETPPLENQNINADQNNSANTNEFIEQEPAEEILPDELDSDSLGSYPAANQNASISTGNDSTRTPVSGPELAEPDVSLTFK
ncbi:MAG: hypothetical protein WC107_02210 [Patescibacteria group bacterium]